MTPIAPIRLVAARAAARAVLCVVALFGAAGAAVAQTTYPMGSLQGIAQFGAYPKIRINCIDYTLGPGVRVLSPQQRIVPLQQLDGVRSPVVFQRDASGNVFRVWLIAPDAVDQLQVPKAPGQCGLFFGD